MIVNFIYILSILPLLMIGQMNSLVHSAKIVGKLSYKMSIPVTRKMLMSTNNIIRGNQTDVQCLITNRDKKFFCSDDLNAKQLYLNNHEFIKDKKLITISPGGYKGFYMLGVCSFIKENYNTGNYIFSGASAGAWNSLFMTLNKDHLECVLKLLDEDIRRQNSIKDTEYKIKETLLNSYTSDDFDLKRLFIGVTTISRAKPRTNIFSDFDNLEDALNCCIASSHIPFISGAFTNSYNNQMTFDGGFSNYPYLNIKDSILHITPSMWKKDAKKSMFVLEDYTSLFSKSKFSYIELYDNGYKDSKNNKNFLDKIFL